MQELKGLYKSQEYWRQQDRGRGNHNKWDD